MYQQLIYTLFVLEIAFVKSGLHEYYWFMIDFFHTDLMYAEAPACMKLTLASLPAGFL